MSRRSVFPSFMHTFLGFLVVSSTGIRVRSWELGVLMFSRRCLARIVLTQACGAPGVNLVQSLAHPRNIDTRLAKGASLLNLPRWFSPNQQGTAFGEVLRFATPCATLLLQTFNSLLPVGCGKGEVIARRNESLLSMSMSFKYSKLNDPLINATSNTRVRALVRRIKNYQSNRATFYT